MAEPSKWGFSETAELDEAAEKVWHYTEMLRQRSSGGGGGGQVTRPSSSAEVESGEYFLPEI